MVIQVFSHPKVVVKVDNDLWIELINTITPTIVDFINKKLSLSDFAVGGILFEEIHIGVTAFQNFKISQLGSSKDMIELALEQLTIDFAVKVTNSLDNQAQPININFTRSFNEIGFVFSFLDLSNGLYVPFIDFKNLDFLLQNTVISQVLEQNYIQAIQQQLQSSLESILKEKLVVTALDLIKVNLNYLFTLAMQVAGPQFLDVFEDISMSTLFTSAPQFINNSLFLYLSGDIKKGDNPVANNQLNEEIDVDYESDSKFEVYISQSFANTILSTIDNREFRFNDDADYIRVNPAQNGDRVIFTEQGIQLNELSAFALISIGMGLQPDVNFSMNGLVEAEVVQDIFWKLVVRVASFDFSTFFIAESYTAYIQGFVRPLLTTALVNLGHYELPLLNIKLPLGLRLGRMNIQIGNSYARLGLNLQYVLFVQTIRQRLGLENRLII